MLRYIDLRGTPCPVNFIRCRLELEGLDHNQKLKVDLDRGEPEDMVVSGLTKEGHKIEQILVKNNWIRLIITRNEIR
ncbi:MULTISPECIES: sulfurtransferase TusA family protein [unclassified Prochlorococcus]|uniref:sulfurtransferase TusA family protein n=1 Tax=unclassified Prochlorococcus TaxID=2627481 RepID=UPI000533969F|nr:MULTISPECIES: sulfurtransferase TusA family protein [unclassified Prochlorococcus]KGG16931.1 hypothetical protein EV06_0778 [Prochlorococcus sp. MIT 0602]KGG18093.1 hypothetical protein EV07_0005 [Prochlorococcus sp. MIT 0603]